MADTPETVTQGSILPEEIQDLQRKTPAMMNRLKEIANRESRSAGAPTPFLEDATANHASGFRERLAKLIQEFDVTLDSEHEVGLVTFGTTVLHLKDIGFWDPSLISFDVRDDDGQPAQLIQHVSQINLLLTKVDRRNLDEPKRQIGFHVGLAHDGEV